MQRLTVVLLLFSGCRLVLSTFQVSSPLQTAGGKCGSTSQWVRRSPFLSAASANDRSDQSEEESNDDDVVQRAIEMMMSGGFNGSEFETPETTQTRIRTLVDENRILLFMKGPKSFPQCGFSDTATKILDSYEINYHTVDVLADQAIREQVKIFSQWPTIPQLYIDGEFIGGSDIMIEMYQNGELKEIIEKL